MRTKEQETRHAYYLANREKMKRENLAYYHNLTEAEKEARKARQRERHAQMTPEQKTAYYENQKFYKRRAKKGNEWMMNLPSLAEIRNEWERCESEVQYVSVPTIDL